MRDDRRSARADNVVPLLPRAGHRSPPLGCDYRAFGNVSGLRWAEVRACLDAGGEERAALLGWIDGALTALNMALHDTFDLSPYVAEEPMRDFVLAVSAAKPNWPLHAVMLEVARTLAPFRARADGPGVQCGQWGAAFVLRASFHRLLTEALCNRGFFARRGLGSDDARRVRAALLRFQSAVELPLSGVPDPATLARLAEV